MKFKLILLYILLFNSYAFAQFGEQQIVTTNAAGAGSVHSADLDGDGDMDVLSASEGDEKIAWYKNTDGLGNLGAQQIITQSLGGAVDVFVADIDGDGDLDVLAAAKQDDRIVWFENTDGLGNFGPQQNISLLTSGALSVHTADLDGDGDMDVLSASNFDNKIAWYENTDGLGNFGAQQIITNISISVFSVFAADLDGDGDMDVLCNSSSNGAKYPSWFENDGNGNFGSQQEITQDTLGSIFTIAEDVDGDGDMDVLNVEFGGNTIAWFENLDGLGNFGPKIIISILEKPYAIYAIDLDNDGDIDVVSVNHDDLGGSVFWHENVDGLGDFSEKQIISSNIIGGRGVFASDLDGDGDIDVLSASIADHKIAWYENLTILGIEEIKPNMVVIYPNPTTDKFFIESFIPVKKVLVYDVIGRLVLVDEGNISYIDISDLKSGLLIVKLETDNGSVIKKIIKE